MSTADSLAASVAELKVALDWVKGALKSEKPAQAPNLVVAGAEQVLSGLTGSTPTLALHDADTQATTAPVGNRRSAVLQALAAYRLSQLLSATGEGVISERLTEILARLYGQRACPVPVIAVQSVQRRAASAEPAFALGHFWHPGGAAQQQSSGLEDALDCESLTSFLADILGVLQRRLYLSPEPVMPVLPAMSWKRAVASDHQASMLGWNRARSLAIAALFQSWLATECGNHLKGLGHLLLHRELRLPALLPPASRLLPTSSPKSARCVRFVGDPLLCALLHTSFEKADALVYWERANGHGRSNAEVNLGSFGHGAAGDQVPTARRGLRLQHLVVCVWLECTKTLLPRNLKEGNERDSD